MPQLKVPPDVAAVFRRNLTCEFTTVNKQGQPLTWPTLPFYDEAQGRFVITAPVAFPLKAANARRNPHVSLLYSDPTGSGLTNQPIVLVQGDATVADMVREEDVELGARIFKESVRRQPSARRYVGNPIARSLFLFYFQRIGIYVQPRRILVWPGGDMQRDPVELEVAYVE